MTLGISNFDSTSRGDRRTLIEEYFDEEPVFPDSEEEAEYDRLVSSYIERTFPSQMTSEKVMDEAPCQETVRTSVLDIHSNTIPSIYNEYISSRMSRSASKCKDRRTALESLFDEDPVFSDSEVEAEYDNLISSYIAEFVTSAQDSIEKEKSVEPEYSDDVGTTSALAINVEKSEIRPNKKMGNFYSVEKVSNHILQKSKSFTESNCWKERGFNHLLMTPSKNNADINNEFIKKRKRPSISKESVNLKLKNNFYFQCPEPRKKNRKASTSDLTFKYRKNNNKVSSTESSGDNGLRSFQCSKKFRKLYSSEDWLQSQDFSSIQYDTD